MFDRKPKRAAEHQASDMSECIDQCNVKKKGQEETTSALQLTGKVNAVHVKSVSTVRGLLLCEFISVRKTSVFRFDHTGY